MRTKNGAGNGRRYLIIGLIISYISSDKNCSLGVRKARTASAPTPPSNNSRSIRQTRTTNLLQETKRNTEPGMHVDVEPTEMAQDNTLAMFKMMMVHLSLQGHDLGPAHELFTSLKIGD
ncbi:unnamed protein product [Ectocarpus sp. 12 AP-2014]